MQITKLTMEDIKNQIEMIQAEMIYTNFNPDLICGIQLGGLVPALMLAKKFHYPHIGTIELGAMGKPIYKKQKGERILIIDDIADSGQTFLNTVNEFQLMYPEAEIKTAALVYKVHTSKWNPDYKGVTTNSNAWIQYPWEWNDE